MDPLRIFVELYYDFQKGRIAYNNRLNLLPEDIRSDIEDNVKVVGDGLKKFENTMKKVIEKIIATHPDPVVSKMYELLRQIKGIGVIMAADIIAWTCIERDFLMGKTHPFLKNIRDLPYAKIEEYDNKMVRVKLPPVLTISKYPSDFYKYAGLIPGSVRRRGEKINYNPKLKTHFWKMVRQILMSGRSHYVYLYKTWKAQYWEKYKDRKDLPAPKAMAHYTAVKKVGRHLALTIYLAYKCFREEPAYLPYPVSLLGHSIDPPFVDGPDGKPNYLYWLIDYASKFDKSPKF